MSPRVPRTLAIVALVLFALFVLVEVFVYSPTAAAVLGAAILALGDYYRRRRSLW
jgi:hypothetical protein